MKKIIAMLMLAIISFGAFIPLGAAPLQVKKDGTLDKRFKENKKAKGPLKKDGTPDMRHKANKTK
jgi:hypothetical protein